MQKKHWFRSGLIVLFIFAFCGASVFADTYFIGVALPLSGEKKDRGEKILTAAQMKVDELNVSGKLGGHRIELVVRDDESKPETSKKIAEDFSADKRIMAVMGHYDASIAIPAAEVYAKNKLAILSPSVGSSSFLKNDTAFSMTFQDDRQLSDVAAFIQAFEPAQNIAVIYASGNYGTVGMTGFTNKAIRLGMKVKPVVFNEKKDIPENYIVSNFSATEKIDAFIVIAHADKGLPIIRQLRDNGFSAPIYGADRMTSGLLENLEMKYKKSLFVVFPFMFDFAPMEAYEFSKAFRKKTGSEASVWAGFGYDGIGILAQAIVNKPDRESVINALVSMKDEESAYDGMTGTLFFEPNRSMKRTAVISRVSSGGDMYKPLYDQLKEVTDGHTLRELEKKIVSGEVALLGDTPFYKVKVVFVGIDFARVNNIDMKSGTFSLDFYVWYRWSGDLDIDNIVFPNNTGDIVLTPLRNDTNALVKWQSYRGQGTFLAKFDLRKFPFDIQKLPVWVAHKNKNGNKIQFLIDRERIRSSKFNAVPEEWYYLGRQDSGGTYIIDSVFGNPSYSTTENQAEFSRIQTDIDLKRNIFPYMINLFLPLAIVVLLSLLVAFIPKEEFEIKVNLCMTAILTVVVFQMSQSGNLPPLGYPTVGDIYFMLSYLFVFLFTIKNFVMMSIYSKQKETGVPAKKDQFIDMLFVVGSVLVFGIYTLTVLLS